MSITTFMTNLRLQHIPRILQDADQRYFRVVALISQGGQGRVYRIQYLGNPPIPNRTDYAYKEAVSARRVQSIINERNTLQCLNNVPHIPPYISHTNEGFIRPFYQTIDRNDIYLYGHAIIDCIEQLHHAGWVHGDIKYDNFALDTKGKVYIIDLGSAQRINEFNVDNLETALFQGSRRNNLVELFQQQPNLSPTLIDIYGFVWMMYISVGGYTEPPWPTALPTTVDVQEWRPSGIKDPNVSHHLRELLYECCVDHPAATRPL
jgi:serine/threonine protein kinase